MNFSQNELKINQDITLLQPIDVIYSTLRELHRSGYPQYLRTYTFRVFCSKMLFGNGRVHRKVDLRHEY
jgi:hypothetical protein